MLQNTQIHDILKIAIRNGLNVLLSGPHGQGKTSSIDAVAQDLHLKLKYFSASTLDPWADLVGIPVPVERDGHRDLVYYQQHDLLDAELLVFDELNRALPKVLNAVQEIIQFRRINGVPLPHLRAVIAAINPAGGAYQVQELDPALVDRFHLYISFSPGPDQAWFRAKFGQKIGSALIDWFHTDIDKTQQAAVSPRRLEFIGLALKIGIDLAHSVPVGVKLPFHLLQQRLKELEGVLNVEDFVGAPDKYAEIVANDLNAAVRFAALLPVMKPAQKNVVKFVLLALPGEVLAQLLAKTPFVFPKTVEDVRKNESPEDAEAFRSLLEERLQPIKAQLKGRINESDGHGRNRKRAA